MSDNYGLGAAQDEETSSMHGNQIRINKTEKERDYVHDNSGNKQDETPQLWKHELITCNLFSSGIFGKDQKEGGGGRSMGFHTSYEMQKPVIVVKEYY